MNGDYEVSVSQILTPFNFPKPHYHDYYEIYYLLSGERYFYIENQSYHLKKGSLVFVNRNALHKTMTADRPEHKRFIVYFTRSFIEPSVSEQKDLLDPFESSHNMIHLNQQEQAFIENIIFGMINEYSDDGRKGRALYFKTLLLQLLLCAGRFIPEGSESELRPSEQMFHQIIQFCIENYRGPLTLNQIAAHFFLSPSYVGRLFKKHTGFSFPEYLNTLRIREAQRLLRETDLKIIEVADQVGYINNTHFNRNFKQMIKVSPLEYRRMTRNEIQVMVKHTPEFLERNSR